MKRLVLSMLITVFAANAFANIGSKSTLNLTEAGTKCLDCENKPNRTAQQLQEFSAILVAGGNVQELSDANREMHMAPRCEFVEGDDLGPWGEIIITEMRTHKQQYSDLYNGTADLERDCPMYPRLEDKDKELVWVMILNTMAFLESTCNESVEARGIKGRTAIGLLQLHKNHESRNGCPNGSGNEAETTLPCGLNMLNTQLGREGELFAERGETYWAVLREDQTKHKKIRTAIQKLAFCRAT